MRPDIFSGVVGAVVPYLSAAGDFAPVEQIASYLPTLSYQIYFEKETNAAIAELNKDIRRSIRSIYRTIESPPPKQFLTSSQDFLGAYDNEIMPSTCLTQEEEDYLVEQYKLQGFDHTLQFYTHKNRIESHSFSHNQGNFTIKQPVLAIYPSEDPVADWLAISKLLQSDSFIPNLTTELIRAQHWPQLESSVEFNNIIKKWLEYIPSESTKKKHIDEL